MVDVFSEVNEDLRREKLKKLWKKLGPFVIGGAVVIVAVMGGRVYWADHVASQRILESEQYQAALGYLAHGEDELALAAFDELIATSEYGYGLLSRLQKASNLAASGDISGALDVYDTVSADAGLTRKFRDYAALMATLIIIDQGRTADAYERLTPLAAPGNDWYYTANEMLGLMYFNDGRYQDAEDIFAGLAVDPKTPVDLRNRAGEFLEMIDNKKPAAGLLGGNSPEDPGTE